MAGGQTRGHEGGQGREGHQSAGEGQASPPGAARSLRGITKALARPLSLL